MRPANDVGSAVVIEGNIPVVAGMPLGAFHLPSKDAESALGGVLSRLPLHSGETISPFSSFIDRLELQP